MVLVVSSALTIAAYALLWLRRYWFWKFDPFSGVPVAYLGTTKLDAAWMVAAWGIPTLLYAAALIASSRALRRHTRFLVFATPVLSALLLVPTVPPLAGDFFDYLMSGRILSAYWDNPYLTVPSQFTGDPYLPPVVWKDLPNVYGPAWIWIAALATAVGGDSTTASYLLLKLLVVAAHLGTGAFIYLTVRHLAPERAEAAFVTYTWNPFVLIHFAVDGHNDAFMLLFLTAAVAAAVRERWELAFPALAASILVKFVPLVLLPVFLLAARRQPGRAFIGGCLAYVLSVGVCIVLWNDPDVFDGLRWQSRVAISSPGAVALRWWELEDVRQAGVALFAAAYVITLWRLRSLHERCFAVVVLYLFALSLWTRPWYFTWPLALGAIVGGWPLVVAVAGGLGACTFYLWSGYVSPFNWWHWRDRWGPRQWWFEQAVLTAAPYGATALAATAYFLSSLLRRSEAWRRGASTVSTSPSAWNPSAGKDRRSWP